MNKSELIDAIAAETKLTKKDTDAFLKSFVEQVSAALEKGDEVGFWDSELFLLEKDLPVLEEIQKQAKQLLLQLAKVQNLRQELHLKIA